MPKTIATNTFHVRFVYSTRDIQFTSVLRSFLNNEFISAINYAALHFY